MSGNSQESYVNSWMVRHRFKSLLEQGLYAYPDTDHINRHKGLLEDDIRPAIYAFLGYYFNDMYDFNKTNSHHNKAGKTDIYIEKIFRDTGQPKIVMVAELKKEYASLTPRIQAPIQNHDYVNNQENRSRIYQPSASINSGVIGMLFYGVEVEFFIYRF